LKDKRIIHDVKKVYIFSTIELVVLQPIMDIALNSHRSNRLVFILKLGPFRVSAP
jgi:hypothetical protein